MNSILEGKIFKVIVLGDGFVGKTAITTRFCEDQFQQEYKMTIGVNFGNKTLRYKNNEIYNLQIWDVAGQERFKFLRTSYYAGAFGVILVYDVTNKLTFLNLANWTVEFQEKIGTKPAIVVANKVDLPTSGMINQMTRRYYEREVSSEDGKEFADFLNAPYIETSAKNGLNVHQLFTTLVDLIEDKGYTNELYLDSYDTIEFGFTQLEGLLYQQDVGKVYDALLKLKQSIFQQNPYSIVLGNVNAWAEYIPRSRLSRVIREKLAATITAWKVHYPQSMQEGQAVHSEAI